MMKQVVSGITNYLIQEKIIDEKEKSIYLFGFNLFFKYLVCIVFTILLGAMNHSLKEVVIIILLFLPLRSYAGGIHLKKDSFCLIVTARLYCAVIAK